MSACGSVNRSNPAYAHSWGVVKSARCDFRIRASDHPGILGIDALFAPRVNFRGCFLDARREECAVRNEQMWLDLEEELSHRLGDRYGMIKFGSRTEVLVPADDAFDVRVRVGDAVKGGATVLLQYRSSGDG
jgi:phosphatidylserine decarboxylase